MARSDRVRIIAALVIAFASLGGLAACSDDAVQAVGSELGFDQTCIDGVEAMLDASSLVAGTLDDDIDSVDDLRFRFQAFVDAAPAELRGDLDTVLDGYAGYLQTADEDAEGAHALLETESFTSASGRIGDWLAEHCDVGTTTTLG